MVGSETSGTVAGDSLTITSTSVISYWICASEARSVLNEL